MYHVHVSTFYILIFAVTVELQTVNESASVRDRIAFLNEASVMK